MNDGSVDSPIVVASHPTAKSTFLVAATIRTGNSVGCGGSVVDHLAMVVAVHRDCLHLPDSGDGRSVSCHCCDAESWPVVPKSSWSTTIQTHIDGNTVNAILVVRSHLVCGDRLAVHPNKEKAMRRTRTKKETEKGRKVLMVTAKPLLGQFACFVVIKSIFRRCRA